MKRVHKQTLIAVLYFIILILIAVAVYFLFFKKEPSPNDRPDKPSAVLSKIEILETVAVQPKSGYYDLAAKIKNPNNSHGAFFVPYEFKIYSEDGGLLNVRQGKTFILPASEKYLVETKVQADKLVRRIEFEIFEAKWKEFREFQPEIFIYEKKFELLNESGVYAQASGILRNSSPFDLDKININIILRDMNRKIIGLNNHQLFTLSSGQDRYFAARWFSPIPGKVAQLELEPEFNVFLDDNFIRRYGVLEKFLEF